MPFLKEITNFIDAKLKADAFIKKNMQPVRFYGLATIVPMSKVGEPKKIMTLPAIVSPDGKGIPISPNHETALQIYHRPLKNYYSQIKKSFGDGYYLNSKSDFAMIVFVNTTLLGNTQDAIEPIILRSFPQKLSAEMLVSLNIKNALITPVGSNLNQYEVFKQEYPNSEYFLTESMSMFSFTYRVELIMKPECLDACVC